MTAFNSCSTGYSYLHNPHLCLLFESMDAISWNFARTSHVAYANQLGTTSTVASIQGLLGGLTFGLGKHLNITFTQKGLVKMNWFIFFCCRIWCWELWRKFTNRGLWPASDFSHSGRHLLRYRPILLSFQYLLFTSQEYCEDWECNESKRAYFRNIVYTPPW